MNQDWIYLDNNSTTPLDKRVSSEIIPFFEDLYANASSNHSFGHLAKEYIQTAREDVARLINAEPHEVVFYFRCYRKHQPCYKRSRN